MINICLKFSIYLQSQNDVGDSQSEGGGTGFRGSRC